MPAALIVEEGSEDATRVIREEAKHRFLNKKGIRVFSRPEHLKDWLEKRGEKLEDYLHLIVDAGRVVPGWMLDSQGIEFFVHSLFAERTENGVLDRNANCLVMQAVIRAGSEDTKVLITGDITHEELDKIVAVTKKHKNEHRLAWDIYDIPHHCSYLSLGPEKGDSKTEAAENIDWLLQQGSDKGIMVCSSKEIPSESDKHPPHVEAYKRYKDTANELDADLEVTMEWPTKAAPGRMIVEITEAKAKLKKTSIGASTAVVSSVAPRVG